MKAISPDDAQGVGGLWNIFRPHVIAGMLMLSVISTGVYVGCLLGVGSIAEFICLAGFIVVHVTVCSRLIGRIL